MTHLMREDLVRWRDEGRDDDRARIISHLASCTSCAALYAELIRTAPAKATPVHFDPADFVQRGYAVRRDSSARAAWSSAFMSWKLWAGALSAAAALLLMIVLVPSPRPESSDTRGTRIELLTPQTPGRPMVLEWKSGIAAASYRVELMDAAGAVVYQTMTGASHATLPADVLAKLAASGSCTWTVTALDADGRPVTASSRRLTFADAAK